MKPAVPAPPNRGRSPSGWATGVSAWSWATLSAGASTRPARWGSCAARCGRRRRRRRAGPVLDRLDVFVEQLPAARLATVVYAEVEPAGAGYGTRARAPAAGGRPARRRPSAAVARSVGSAGRAGRRHRRPDAKVELPHRSRLLLYSDGLVERRTEPIDDELTRLLGLLARRRDDTLDVMVDATIEAMLAERPTARRRLRARRQGVTTRADLCALPRPTCAVLAVHHRREDRQVVTRDSDHRKVHDAYAPSTPGRRPLNRLPLAAGPGHARSRPNAGKSSRQTPSKEQPGARHPARPAATRPAAALPARRARPRSSPAAALGEDVWIAVRLPGRYEGADDLDDGAASADGPPR